MVNFQHPSLAVFLKEYWQKKPLLIPNALPSFTHPISPDELAGLALEEEVESRIIQETPNQSPRWHLQHGPFKSKHFQSLPKSHWTLLVQGVDRLIPGVYHLLEHFNFIPPWRLDDVMISFAALHGSVGPHFDNYDVFLYQAKGKRKWSLTTQDCHQKNYIPNLELRIMDRFVVEEEMILEEGDMLYLPPHVGHHGVSLSEECMTYSFGYRSYQAQELWDSFGDYLAEKQHLQELYPDPDWSLIKNSAQINKSAWKNAQNVLKKLIEDEQHLKSWFGCFATRLDQQAEQQLTSLEQNTSPTLAGFIKKIKKGAQLILHPACRVAYYDEENHVIRFYMNGSELDVQGVTFALLHELANHRSLDGRSILFHLDNTLNQDFILNLYQLGWLYLE